MQKSKLMALGFSIFALSVFIPNVNAEVTAEPDSRGLESGLEELRLPNNIAPAGITSERLYSVQNRYSSLKKRSEVTVGASHNFTGNSFLSMNQFDLAYRYHFNNRWNISASGSYATNSLTDGANLLYAANAQLPDIAYVKYRADVLVGYHLFYGKFRLGMNEVLYFDQYVAIGPGIVNTQYGSAPAGVIDIGFVFWAGRHMSVRFGFKNDLFTEQRAISSTFQNHLLGHFDVGYAFGNGSDSGEVL